MGRQKAQAFQFKSHAAGASCLKAAHPFKTAVHQPFFVVIDGRRRAHTADICPQAELYKEGTGQGCGFKMPEAVSQLPFYRYSRVEHPRGAGSEFKEMARAFHSYKFTVVVNV